VYVGNGERLETTILQKTNRKRYAYELSIASFSTTFASLFKCDFVSINQINHIFIIPCDKPHMKHKIVHLCSTLETISTDPERHAFPR